MDTSFEVRWHLASWNDVLRLRVPAEMSSASVAAEIERHAETLEYWADREEGSMGELPWSWVMPDLKLGQLHLEAWFPFFPDLRVFFLGL